MVFAAIRFLSTSLREDARRAMDQDGEVVNVFLQARSDGKGARRFLKRVLKRHQDEPRKTVTNRLRSDERRSLRTK